MTNKNTNIHSEMMDKVSQVLRKNNFSIYDSHKKVLGIMYRATQQVLRNNNFPKYPLYEFEKKSWDLMKNVTIIPDKHKIRKIIDERWYFGRQQKSDILLALKGEVSCAFCPKNDEGWALHLRTEVLSFRACTYKKFILDVLGCLHDGSKFDYDKIIAVEVSFSSDIKKEILKLKKVPTRWKVVVTENINGELEGIPVVSMNNFEDFVQNMLKDDSV